MAGMLQAKKCLRKCAKRFDSDHTAHTQSIIRAFAFNTYILLYSFYLRRVKIWLDCAAAHAEHNLCNLHMFEDRCSHDEMQKAYAGDIIIRFLELSSIKAVFFFDWSFYYCQPLQKCLHLLNIPNHLHFRVDCLRSSFRSFTIEPYYTIALKLP